MKVLPVERSNPRDWPPPSCSSVPDEGMRFWADGFFAPLGGLPESSCGLFACNCSWSGYSFFLRYLSKFIKALPFWSCFFSAVSFADRGTVVRSFHNLVMVSQVFQLFEVNLDDRETRSTFGLDKPWLNRPGRFFSAWLQGDFPHQIRHRHPGKTFEEWKIACPCFSAGGSLFLPVLYR